MSVPQEKATARGSIVEGAHIPTHHGMDAS